MAGPPRGRCRAGTNCRQNDQLIFAFVGRIRIGTSLVVPIAQLAGRSPKPSPNCAIFSSATPVPPPGAYTPPPACPDRPPGPARGTTAGLATLDLIPDPDRQLPHPPHAHRVSVMTKQSVCGGRTLSAAARQAT